MRRSLLVAFALVATESALFAQVARPDVAFTSPTAGPAARLGESVDVDGDRAIVGAVFGDGASGGTAHVFERQPNGAWVEVAKVSPPTTFDGAGLGVALDGDRAAVGARQGGFVAIVERQPNGTWLEVATIPQPSGESVFGRFPVLDGDRLYAATELGGPFLGSYGSVHVFERQANGSWTSAGSMTPIGPGPLSIGGGTTMAADGDRVVMGVTNDGDAGPFTGAAYVFERQPNGTWQQAGRLLSPSPASSEFFGSSVSIEGDSVLVGAPGESATLIGAGAMYEYVRAANGVWTYAGDVVVAGLAANDAFGSAHDREGDLLAVGASGSDVDVVNAGAVYLFRRDAQGVWREVATVVHEGAAAFDGAGSGSGHSVDLDGARLAFGAFGVNSQDGAVHLLDVGTLFHGDTRVSISGGNAQDFLLRAGPERAGDAFLMLGSMSGTSPGVTIAPGIDLPLVVDAYTNLALGFAIPVFPAVGVLDAAGAADGFFALPGGTSPSFAGAVIHHAYVTLDLATFEVGASNAVRVELEI